MSNSFFNFKQFNIHQNKCAMKVCTDACLFGAWIAEKNKDVTLKHALDIGTGTGLLSLMLAQKNINVKIDAIEIDDDAALQANENFNASKFRNNINIFHTPIQQFETKIKYDLILSNPPFFLNALKSNNEKRNTALHTGTLNFSALLISARKNISSNGTFVVLLNSTNTTEFLSSALLHGFHLHHQVNVKQTPFHKPFRALLYFGNYPSPPIIEEIIIKNVNGEYTPNFKNLLKDYYLYL